MLDFSRGFMNWINRGTAQKRVLDVLGHTYQDSGSSNCRSFHTCYLLRTANSDKRYFEYRQSLRPSQACIQNVLKGIDADTHGHTYSLIG